MHVLIFKFQRANLAILWLNTGFRKDFNPENGNPKDKKSRQRRVKNLRPWRILYISSSILGQFEVKVKEEAFTSGAIPLRSKSYKL